MKQKLLGIATELPMCVANVCYQISNANNWQNCVDNIGRILEKY